MNLNMIIDQYVLDQSHNFCRYLAANDGDWLERDFPKDVIPVCEKGNKNYGAMLKWQKNPWNYELSAKISFNIILLDLAVKIIAIFLLIDLFVFILWCQKVLECSARENCHIKELFQTLFSLSGLPRIIERFGPMLKKSKEMRNHFHGNHAKKFHTWMKQ